MSFPPVSESPASDVRMSSASRPPLSGGRRRGVLPLQRRSARGFLRSLAAQVALAGVLGVFAVAATWTPTAPAVARSGHVSRLTGAAGVAVGDACDVRIDPETRAGLNCRVTVTCGARTLFGGQMLGGYAACEVEEGKYGSALDAQPTSKDGDPAVEVDLGRKLARVTDDGNAHEVEIELTP
jgi:hypothetical protein